MTDKPVLIPRGRARTFTCAFCGAYLFACTHATLTIVAPQDTDREVTHLIAANTSAPDTGMVTVVNAVTEEELRVDMPWLEGFMTTKRST